MTHYVGSIQGVGVAELSSAAALPARPSNLPSCHRVVPWLPAGLLDVTLRFLGSPVRHFPNALVDLSLYLP
ncbi:protein of unknown function (plasmid) [Caballeronia sp. S22]